jgi:hypothetical protein
MQAQLKAAQAQLAEEKELVHRHRLSADLLAQLSDKVRHTDQGHQLALTVPDCTWLYMPAGPVRGMPVPWYQHGTTPVHLCTLPLSLLRCVLPPTLPLSVRTAP